MNKIELFQKELDGMGNDYLVEDAKVLIEVIPDYIFEVPASSSGKYHPASSLGEGGLYRHILGVAQMVNYLATSMGLSSRDKDLLVIGAIMHDSCKSGLENSGHTLHEHPLLAVELIESQRDKLSMSDEELEIITSAVGSHMGQWNTHWSTDIVLPTPSTPLDYVLHSADYLASRKSINIVLD